MLRFIRSSISAEILTTLGALLLHLLRVPRMRSAAPRWQCSERPVVYSNSIKVCKQSSVWQGALWHLEYSLTIYKTTHTGEKIRIDGSSEIRQRHDCYLEFPKLNLETISNTSANADKISTTSTTSPVSVEV